MQNTNIKIASSILGYGLNKHNKIIIIIVMIMIIAIIIIITTTASNILRN